MYVTQVKEKPACDTVAGPLFEGEPEPRTCDCVTSSCSGSTLSTQLWSPTRSNTLRARELASTSTVQEYEYEYSARTRAHSDVQYCEGEGNLRTSSPQQATRTPGSVHTRSMFSDLDASFTCAHHHHHHVMNAGCSPHSRFPVQRLSIERHERKDTWLEAYARNLLRVSVGGERVLQHEVRVR